MRLLVNLTFTRSLMFGQIVAASPREDAEFIMERVIAENGGRASYLHEFASRHVFFFKRELAKHSVKTVDPNRFAENFPVQVVEPWFARWQEIYVDYLLEKFTPAELVQIANILGAEMEKPDASQTFGPEDSSFAWPVLAGMVAADLKVSNEIKQSMPQLNDAPYLADILETDGIFTFPNRIWRKDFIAKLRGGH